MTSFQQSYSECGVGGGDAGGEETGAGTAAVAGSRSLPGLRGLRGSCLNLSTLPAFFCIPAQQNTGPLRTGGQLAS